MNTTTQQNRVLNHEEIARLASQIWQQEGGQSGRDQEYWLRAEQQLRAISQQGNVPNNRGLVQLNASESGRQIKAGQPGKPAGASDDRLQKRVSVKLKRK